jgi:hypothetical protein
MQQELTKFHVRLSETQKNPLVSKIAYGQSLISIKQKLGWTLRHAGSGLNKSFFLQIAPAGNSLVTWELLQPSRSATSTCIKKSGAHPSNFELALSKGLKCYNVFHTDRLKPYHAPNEYVPGRHDPRTTKVQHDHGTFSIEKILDFKCHHGKPVFLVQWKNYSLDWATWESAAHLFRDTDIDTRFAITQYLVSRGSVELEELASKYGFNPVSAESLLSKIGIKNSQGNPIRRARSRLSYLLLLTPS